MPEPTIGTALVAAGAAQTAKLFASVIEKIHKTISGPAQTVAIKALARLEGYSSYLEETNDRVSTFKSFANPAAPVSLLDHFVTTTLKKKQGDKSFDQDDILDKLTKPSRLVVSATAGYGKSMLMRFLALSFYENPRGKIPLFVELRDLNRVRNPDILAYMHATYKRTNAIQLEAFKHGLDVGLFILILDGFDELNHEIRPLIEEQILEISRTYKKSSVVVSGRPDDRFQSWRSFTVAKICPMSKEQVIELIAKLEYDRGTKKRFVSKIKAGLFETHESFLSTPLLAILMLLTFEENANIPDKMHLFYGKAFETLFHKHDATKEQYDRQRKSGLQIDEFEKVFSVFCLKTYVQERIEFNKTEIIRSVKEAIIFEGKNVKSEDVLFDLEEAVCLLQREGSSYFFVHRSFQEYFTAVFLSGCPAEIRDEFIDQVATRYWDNVLPMLFDMASSQLEPSWVVDRTDEYLLETGFEAGQTSPLLAKWSGISFHVTANGAFLSGVMPAKYASYMSIMRRFYPAELAMDTPVDWDTLENDVTALARAGVVPFGPLPVDEPGANNISRLNITMDKFPEDMLKRCGLERFANEEFQRVKKLRSEIDTSQQAKNEFLAKLFAIRPT